jgi:hypothetical protein
MTRNVQNEAIIRTKAACHLEGIDQFCRAGHIHGDGLSTHLRDIDPKTETGGPVAREFNEAVGAKSPAENEARSVGHDRQFRHGHSSCRRGCKACA